jgi:hypothetical protein
MPNPPNSGLPNPASYDTSKPGVVLDKVTHLMWQQPIDPGTYLWGDAQAHCSGLSLAGHHGWRLPTVIELYSLLDFTQMKPAIDPTAFPNTPVEWFWSSSSEVLSRGDAWGVGFDDGSIGDLDVGHAHRVRCVR